VDISNELIFKAVNAFVDVISDAITEKVYAQIEQRMDATKTIIENFSDRIDKVEQSLDSEFEVTDRLKRVISSVVEAELDDYDPTDVTGFSRAVVANIEDYMSGRDFTSAVCDVINDMDLRVEARN